MTISSTYRKLLFEALVNDKIKLDTYTSFKDIQNYITENLNTLDLSVPQFSFSDYEIAERDFSSAAKFNNTFNTIRQDLRVLYKEMFNLSKTSIEDFGRWQTEADILEKRLSVLENSVASKLLLAQDTEGFHSFFFENFSDAANVDSTLTTAAYDLSSQRISLNGITNNPRVFLNELESRDVSFKIKSSIGYIGRQDSVEGDLTKIFHQESRNWWTRISMKDNKAVVCELFVRLGEEPVSINGIYLELHESSQSNLTTITPLYSVDNYSFRQLSDTASSYTSSYTQKVSSKASFDFEAVNAKYIKFVLIKEGADSTADDGTSLYEFGFKEISFYSEIFTANTSQDFVSETLSILDTNEEPKDFSKVALETCELFATDSNNDPVTSINYSITAGDDTPIAVDSDTVWQPISPASEASPKYPSVIDLGDLTEVELASVGVSYLGTSSTFRNPAQTFTLLSQDTDDSVLSESVDATARRYVFNNSNERILDYQIKDSTYTGSGTGTALEIDEDRITIFRNVGERGLTAENSVRSIQRGWRYEEPYYITVVEILDSNGISIDVGDNYIIIDGVEYDHNVDKGVLKGKTSSFNGLHEIKVHKKNWKHVTPELNTLTGTSGLVIADPLYPYNHKLLIEGYDYGENYPADQERVYLGADNFFERRMKKISIFDLVGNISVDGYSYYSLDRDAPTTHTDGNSSTLVFVVKVDGVKTDAVNEKFLIRFNLISQRYTYFRLKATLSTEGTTIGPALNSYRLKFGD